MGKYIKSLIVIFMLLIFSIVPSYADVVPSKVYAITQNNLNCQNTDKNTKIELVSYDDYGLEDIVITQGSTLTVILSEYKSAKRGKLNGYYKIKLIAVDDKNVQDFGYYGTMKIAEPKDMKEIVEKAGVTIAGAVLNIPGLSQGVAVAKGIINPNENESRLKSAGKNLYESTPLTYAEKGEDFSVEANDIVVLRLRK